MKKLAVFCIFLAMIKVACAFADEFGKKSYDDHVVLKTYGELAPHRGGLKQYKSPRFMEKMAFDTFYEILYYNDEHPVRPLIAVQILHIVNHQAAIDYLTKKAYRMDDESYKNKFINKEIIYSSWHSDYEMYWLHDSYMIYIFTRSTKIPTEMQNDYLAKYPPTHKFTKEDLSPERMMKSQLKMKAKRINELEKERGWFTRLTDKVQEYEAMQEQCWLEQTIRCNMGMLLDGGKTGCPIAFNLDDSEREKAWKELEKQLNDKKVIMENVYFVNLDSFDYEKCLPNEDYQQKAALELLGLQEHDLPGYWEPR